MHRGEIETAAENIHQFFTVEGKTAARATQRKGWANDDGEADLGSEIGTVTDVIDQRRPRHVETDACHRILEQQPVLSLLDGFEPGPDHLHVVLFENAGVRKIDREVESGLTADRGQQSNLADALTVAAGHAITFAADDFFHVLPGQRLDVGAIREFRVGHDGGRVGVHQHHFIALRLQRLAGLGAGVIKLSRLTNDDRP